MIVFSLQVKAPMEKRFEILKSVFQILDYMRVQPGCDRFELYTSTENDDELLLIEEWRRQEDLEKHILSDEFKIILSVMDMAVEEPVIRVDRTTLRKGMEFIESIRKRIP